MRNGGGGESREEEGRAERSGWGEEEGRGTGKVEAEGSSLPNSCP